MITIKPTYGTNEILISIENLDKTTKRALYNSLQEIGSAVTKEEKRLITTGTRTGRIYKYKGRKYQASSPKEPPANRSGRLARSTRFKVRNHMEMTFGQTAKYAKWIEDGTRRIAPRQQLIKAVRNEHQDSVNTIIRNIKRETKP